MRVRPNSSTSLDASSIVNLRDAPAKDLATDFAINSSRQRSPRLTPASPMSYTIEAITSAAFCPEIMAGTASIFHVSGPNSSISKPCLSRIDLNVLRRADSSGEKCTVSGIRSGCEDAVPDSGLCAAISFSNAIRSCAACGLSVTIPASVSIRRYPDSVFASTLKNFQGPVEDASGGVWSLVIQRNCCR